LAGPGEHTIQRECEGSVLASVVRPGRLQLSLQDPDLMDQRECTPSPRLLQQAALKFLLHKALDFGGDRWREPIFSHVMPSRRGEAKANVSLGVKGFFSGAVSKADNSRRGRVLAAGRSGARSRAPGV